MRKYTQNYDFCFILTNKVVWINASMYLVERLFMLVTDNGYDRY